MRSPRSQQTKVMSRVALPASAPGIWSKVFHLDFASLRADANITLDD
jgi:hypothetical protein